MLPTNAGSNEDETGGRLVGELLRKERSGGIMLIWIACGVFCFLGLVVGFLTGIRFAVWGDCRFWLGP
jgi:hypothetical protein